MTDLIVFSVKNNKYALNIENIQRIIEASSLTPVPNTHPLIDGMMSYEDTVIKVLNYRKLTGLISYEEELVKLFTKLKNAHISWIDALKDSVDNGVKFTKTLNPSSCELGKWIDNFASYDADVAKIFHGLADNHKKLHLSGAEALELYKKDKQKARVIVHQDICQTYTQTIGSLDEFIKKLDLVANSLQKLIIYEHKDDIFALIVDKIEDIAHIEENQIIHSTEEDGISEFLELDGVLDLDGVLINVISELKLPK